MAPCTLRSVSAILRPLAAAPPSSGSSIVRLDRIRGFRVARVNLNLHRRLSSVSATNALSGRSKPSLCGQPSFYSYSKVGDRSRLRFLGVRTEATAAGATTAEPETANAEQAPQEPVPQGVNAEVHAYQAEVSRLLDIIVHSLYSHKEVFLRELVSNASDALDKLRFLSVTEPALLGSNPELVIRIRSVPSEGILIIEDSGIGMTKEELINSLGTIAQSGTANFLKALKENKDSMAGDSNLIGKFGVGFYSAFLVADKVAVSTRRAGTDKQHVWEAEANSSAFVVREETDPEYLMERGTAIILHLKEDSRDFSDPKQIESLVKNYSGFLSFPIYVGRERPQAAPTEGEEVKQVKKEYSFDLVNETQPIWLRSPREVSKEEYLAFYKKTYSEHLEPMAYTHFNTEGEVEFKSLLYVPGMAPFGTEAEAADKQKNIKLYVKRVFISDEFHGELFPRYLCFMKGVIDSNDLPLNVSREMLQESRVTNLLRRRLVKKTFDLFESIMKRDNPEDYKRFWRNFGKYIKLGITEDQNNHKRLCKFLRYYSSKHQDEMTSLQEYVANMKEGQDAIYYFSSESVKSARNAPFLEKLYEKDYEVLFLTEPMDEVSVHTLKSCDGKDFVDVSKEDFDLGEDEEADKLSNEFGNLCDWMKDKLGEKIAKVEVSRRLSSSPCALISGKHGWSANMERIMRAQNLGNTPGLREYMASTRILEINPKHPIIQYLDDARMSGKPGTQETMELLYETALLSSGFIPEDPAGLGTRIYELMTSSIDGGASDNYEQPKVDYYNSGNATQSSAPQPPPSSPVVEPEVM